MPINYIKKFISIEELGEIKDKISEIEKFTSGEIRLCLKHKRTFFEKKKNPRDLALKEFFKLGMHKTEDKTGLLIFILFDERKFEIIADEGINSKISDDKWEKVKAHLKNEFSKGNFKAGLLKTLDEIKDVLITEFPIKPGDKNELSDEIVIN